MRLEQLEVEIIEPYAERYLTPDGHVCMSRVLFAELMRVAHMAGRNYGYKHGATAAIETFDAALVRVTE